MDLSSLPIDIVSIGTIVLLSTIAGIWRAATLRGDMNEKWGHRVQVVKAGLDEAASKRLINLRRQIDDFFSPDGQLSRSGVLADPSLLRASVAEFQKCLNARERLDRRFRILLGIGPLLTAGLIIFAFAVIVGILYSLGVYDTRWVFLAILVFGILSMSGCLISLGFYIFIQHKLASAEILADSAGSDGE